MNKMMQLTPFPIDFVWTFCSPKSDRRKKAFKVHSNELFTLNPLADDIKYSLRSAHMFASWYRHIYIVIADDDEMPQYFRRKMPDVTIVKHSEIIPSQFLPTFNPNVIESYLHKIPRLSEHFVYWNDDTYICKKTSWKHFFTSSGMLINRHYPGVSKHSLNNNPILFVKMMQHAITNYNMDFTRYQHQVYPYKKSIIEEYEQRFSKELKKASFHRFRNPTDFNLLRFSGCFASTEKKAKVIFTDDTYDLFLESGDVDKINALRNSKKPRFLCINNTSSENKHVYAKFDELFKQQAPFEKKHVSFKEGQLV
jgi:hypothetical protein